MGIFIDFGIFRPDAGPFGPELAKAENVVPAHGAHVSLRKKAAVVSVNDGPMTGGYAHVYQSSLQIQKVQISGDGGSGTTGAWLPSPSSPTTLYDKVDEQIPSDADFMFVSGAPTSQTCNLMWPSSLVDPASGAGHYFRWRYRVPSTTGAWTIDSELCLAVGAVTSITRSGSTATVTTTAAHGLSTGNVVRIFTTAGTVSGYNGRFTITVTDGTHFTYTVSGSPETPATGTFFYGLVFAVDTATGTGVTSFVQREYLLTAGEANAISNYTILRQLFTATVAGAVQLLRPTSDVSVGSWLTQAGGSTNLYQTIDETPASDTDYIKTPTLALGGAAYTYVAGLGSGELPLITSGFVFRYRARGTNAGVKGVFRIRQGTTLIKETTRTNIATSFTDFADTFSAVEAALITDPTTLRAEVEGSYPTSTAETVFVNNPPTSDYSWGGGWAPTSGSDRYAMIDEATPSDADYIASDNLFNSVSLSFGVLSDPGVDAGFSIKVRTKGPAFTNLELSLQNIGEPPIHTEVIPVTTSFTTYTITLTSGEISQLNFASFVISLLTSGANNGSDIFVSYLTFVMPEARRLEVSFNEMELPSPARAEVSWAEFECPGLAAAYKGDMTTFFCGSKTKIYTFTESAFSDISGAALGAGTTPAGWRFISFGNHVVATNKGDHVRYRANNAGNFAAAIATPATAPKARFLATVRNQLVLGDIDLAGHASDEVWASKIDDLTNFDLTTPTTLSFTWRFLEPTGQLMGLVGGGSLLAFKRTSLHSLSYTGGSPPYRPDVISDAIGTPFPSSIVKTPYGVFFFDGMTFRQYIPGGGLPQDIGTGILSAYLTDSDFFTEALAPVDPVDLAAEDQQMVGCWDAAAQVITWVYQSVGGTASRHSRGIFYSPSMQQWGTLYDANLNAAYIVGRTNVARSERHLLRGTIGLDWNGTATNWFRFDGSATYSVTFQKKRQALGVEEGTNEPMAYRMSGVIPVFAHRPIGSAPPAGLQVTIEASNEPFFVAGYLTKTTSYSLKSTQGVFPADLTGTWWNFIVTVPELTAQEMLAFRGLYLFAEPAGRG